MPRRKESTWIRTSRGELDLVCASPESPEKDRSREEPKRRETYADKLMKKANELWNTFEYDLAIKFFQRVLDCEQDHFGALRGIAGINYDRHNYKEARKYLLKCISMRPDSEYEMYLDMGQISNGKQAIKYYTKGLEIMETLPLRPNYPEGEDEAKDRRRDVAAINCCMSQIYMTDLCDEEDAESRCRACIEAAISADETDAVAFQCKASFLLVKSEMEEAKKAIEKSLSLWLPVYKKGREERNYSCPLTYEDRIESSKVLIEVQMYDEASDVLDGLLDEFDETVYVWYLLGFLNHLRGTDYFGNTRYYFKKGLQVAKKADSDEDLVENMEKILSEIGPGSDDEDEDEDKENDGGDEECEIASEDEEQEEKENVADDNEMET